MMPIERTHSVDLGAVELGYRRGKIHEESLHDEHLKHTGEYRIIGGNTFRNPHGDPVPQQIERARFTDDMTARALAIARAAKPFQPVTGRQAQVGDADGTVVGASQARQRGQNQCLGGFLRQSRRYVSVARAPACCFTALSTFCRIARSFIARASITAPTLCAISAHAASAD
jgi:hypothetical protein